MAIIFALRCSAAASAGAASAGAEAVGVAPAGALEAPRPAGAVAREAGLAPAEACAAHGDARAASETSKDAGRRSMPRSLGGLALALYAAAPVFAGLRIRSLPVHAALRARQTVRKHHWNPILKGERATKGLSAVRDTLPALPHSREIMSDG